MSRTWFLTGKSIALRPLEPADLDGPYPDWLNDPEVLRYRGAKAFATSRAAAARYIDATSAGDDLVLAVCDLSQGVHVGNVSLTKINWVHRHAEVSIMIGDRRVWGRGYGRDTISTLTAHAFGTMNLHRVWSESPNPAFNAVVRRLGWTREGTRREAFFVDGRYIDIECWSLLAGESRR
jgi:ribosomal-protein-alanine N-acetyltransferase